MTLHRFPSFHTVVTATGGGGVRGVRVGAPEVSQPIRAFRWRQLLQLECSRHQWFLCSLHAVSVCNLTDYTDPPFRRAATQPRLARVRFLFSQGTWHDAAFTFTFTSL